jgi:hypothetical protein
MTARFHSFLMGTAIMATAVADAAADVPGDSHAEEPHASSSYILAAISSGLPKYQPPQPAAPAAKPAAPAPGAAKPASDITSMPAFIVRDVKIPTAEKIMTYKARTKVAMDKYLGPSDGLDRGLLNAITLKQLWKKVPLIGGLDFVGTPVHMSNEDRAFDAGGANDTLPYPHPPPKEKNDPDADVSR